MSVPAEQMPSLQADYQAHRERIEGEAAIGQMEAMLNQPTSQPASGTGSGADRVSDMSSSDPVTGGHSEQQAQQPTTIMGKVGAVAKDIGKGILETPFAMLKGARDSAQSTLNLAKNMGDWMDEHGLDPHFIVNSHGLHIAKNDAEAKAMTTVDNPVADWFSNPELPDPKLIAPTTVTGSIVKNVSQFIYSMAQVNKQAAILGIPAKAGVAGYGINALKGFAAQFEGFDGASGNLANLVEEHPSLRNPVTNFLASKPGDSDAEGRLKNALTGTIQGIALDGFMKAIKVFHSANATKSAIDSVTEDQVAPQNMTDLVNHSIDEEGNHVVTSPNGVSIARQRGRVLQEIKTETQPEFQGMGEGTARTQKMIDVANQNGLDYVSDTQVSPAAAGMYAKLKRMGYQVKENAHSVDEKGNLISDNSSKPVYEVSPPKQPLPAGWQALGDPNVPNREPLTSVSFNKADSKIAAQSARAAQFTTEDASKLGQPNYPDEIGTAPGAQEAGAKQPGVYVNFARMNTTDDVKRAVSELTDHFKGNIEQATRGVRTFEDTKLGAQSVDAWNTLMSRRVGEPLNAEQSLAARQLWASASSKVADLAKIATEEPTPENLTAFRKMLETHAAIQQEVIAARTETARALGSWRIGAGNADERLASALQQLNGEAGLKGGVESTLSIANRVKALAESGDIDGLNNFAMKSRYAMTRDAVLEAWTNGLLTSPMTHVKVTTSNAATMALRIAERKIAEHISSILGDDAGVQVGEAAAQYSGMVDGFKDSLRFVKKTANSLLNDKKLPDLGDDPISNAIKAAKTGTYSIGEDSRPEWMSQGAISSQALNMADSGWVGKGIDLAGQVIRSPGKALQGEHDFFRSIAYRMELNANAVRQATQEVNAGKIAEDALGARVQDLIENPPSNIRISSMDGMRYQTFTDAPGKLATLLQQARQDFPMLRVVLPFYKIPSRIMSFTMERTPLAPLMSTFRQNIAAGGTRQSLALAQMGLGTGVMLATADAVMSGQVTGSGPLEKGRRQAMENEGWKPYSVKVGDRWIQYNRIETTGSTMAMAADAMETMQNFHAGINGDDPDVENLALATTLSIAQDITSKTYLQGLANFFDAMANPKGEGQRVLKSLAGSLVPAGVNSIDTMTDPYKRATYSMMDAIKARTPGFSKDLPPQQNLWGEPVKQGSGLGRAYDLLVPMPSSYSNNEPIDKELIKQGMNITRPSARTSFNGATIDLTKNPQLYARYQELAGNGLKNPAWGMGAKDLLNAIVSGNHPLSAVYNLKSDGPDGGKADMIKDIINRYRDQAKQQLLQENPELQQQVQTKLEAKRALKLPVLQ